MSVFLLHKTRIWIFFANHKTTYVNGNGALYRKIFVYSMNFLWYALNKGKKLQMFIKIMMHIFIFCGIIEVLFLRLRFHSFQIEVFSNKMNIFHLWIFFLDNSIYSFWTIFGSNQIDCKNKLISHRNRRNFWIWIFYLF